MNIQVTEQARKIGIVGAYPAGAHGDWVVVDFGDHVQWFDLAGRGVMRAAEYGVLINNAQGAA